MVPNSGYHADAGIQVLMTMVAGAAFTSNLIKKNNGNGDGEE